VEALLYAYVKRVMNPGCFQRLMFFLVGPQKVGKTGFARWLTGGRLIKGEFQGVGIGKFSAGDLLQPSKDVMIRMMCSRIQLFDDISSFGHKELNRIKAIVTMDTYQERLSYGRFDITLQRRGIMIGTSNESGIIPDDPTGNTRYVPISVAAPIDYVWANTWRGQILAETWARVQADNEPVVDFGTVESEYTDANPTGEKLEEFIELVREGKMNGITVRAESGRIGFKQQAFWGWVGKSPTTWQEKEFKLYAERLGAKHYAKDNKFRAGGELHKNIFVLEASSRKVGGQK
jgi:predicted P-loop ATPase